MSTNKNFARQLVKGKIAETIFAQMLRETGNFTVLDFGYEKVIPELVDRGFAEDEGIVETLRTAPDFAVINNTTKEVKLIEVKYRHTIDAADILQIAKRMHQSWNPSYLFVATLDDFYFGEITKIIENNGAILPLQHKQITAEIQKRYMGLLREFEPSDFTDASVAKSKAVVASATTKSKEYSKKQTSHF